MITILFILFTYKQEGHNGHGVAHLSFPDIELKSRDLNHNPFITSIGSSMIWPSDLLFDLTWPIFKNVQDFIEAKTLTKFHEYQIKNLVSRAYTRLF